MNILHLRASNFYGGPERQLHFHARLARDSEYRVTIASFAENENAPEFLQVIASDGIATHLFPVNSAYDRRTIGLVRTYLKENHVRVLCTHEYRTHIVGLLATSGTDTGWVAFSRGWTKDNLKVRLYHLLDKTLIRLADQIVAVSNAQKQKLVKLLVPAGKISVAYNSITPEAFASVPPVNLRERFDFPPDSIVCISGGRFSREKGQIYFAQAALRALSQNPRLRFVLFGDGPDYAAVTAQVAAAKRTDSIKCPGHEKNLIGCLKGADILVNPSLSEGLPNIVLEGMALGVPVIATSVGGVPELITDRVSGRLVPAGDSQALAEAILELASNRAAFSNWVEAARRTISDHFSFEGQFRAIASVYARFQDSRGGPA